MPLDNFNIGDFFAGRDVWAWFQFTGSLLVSVVTFGRVWPRDFYPYWSGFIGLMLHVGVFVGIFYVQRLDDLPQTNQSARPPAAKAETSPAPKGA
ncbi:hypothetical protein [Roseimicrobium sp. ORNL1]|uniref:hypothetical protein n=1 Tax=Roseimicrobium sp. ORNL1 TaxID=2711231 RepID=UPI0013E1B00B|nr:hypothetical protein [Roseimicrobium sp. ORNL1]QIF01750.1 hypothetical protein G5S37_09510 [Roseimicrobium sp. ORNL1]